MVCLEQFSIGFVLITTSCLNHMSESLKKGFMNTIVFCTNFTLISVECVNLKTFPQNSCFFPPQHRVTVMTGATTKAKWIGQKRAYCVRHGPHKPPTTTVVTPPSTLPSSMQPTTAATLGGNTSVPGASHPMPGIAGGTALCWNVVSDIRKGHSEIRGHGLNPLH